MKYDVEITRTVCTTVSVEADTLEAAEEMADKVSFPLPAADEWHVVKGSYEYTATEAGES